MVLWNLRFVLGFFFIVFHCILHFQMHSVWTITDKLVCSSCFPFIIAKLCKILCPPSMCYPFVLFLLHVSLHLSELLRTEPEIYMRPISLFLQCTNYVTVQRLSHASTQRCCHVSKWSPSSNGTLCRKHPLHFHSLQSCLVLLPAKFTALAVMGQLAMSAEVHPLTAQLFWETV